MTHPFINALRQPNVFPHPVVDFEVIETHLSWVILTGYFAYKIKKPVNLGFQDFTTLEKRKRYCEQEVTLNRRLAPELYLGVVPIAGTIQSPSLIIPGDAVEYAIKMHQFPQEKLLTQLLKENKLSLSDIDSLASQIAHFHQNAEPCALDLPYGNAKNVWLPVQDNFTLLRTLVTHQDYHSIIDTVEEWATLEYEKLTPLINARKQHGWVRACHGDLHLGNMVMIGGKPLIFDCIEFNEYFRWTDVVNDISFLAMDLERLSQYAFRHYFINAYCEKTLDYEGLLLLRFYQCYRAMVRAKVMAFQLQMDLPLKQKQSIENELNTLLHLAKHYTEPHQPSITITFGLSGSGKSTLSQKQSMLSGAIRLRSDNFRLTAFSSSKERYQPHATQHIYHLLAEQAEGLIRANYSVIIDATFLKQWQRELFLTLANRLGVSFHILAIEAPLATLQERLKKRQALANDISEATEDILTLQIKEQDALSEYEKTLTTFFRP